ncbi:MAG: fimbrillin family protein [Bacteroides sp.]|nr:fimbrillin family protein [Bacteroides sp.]
MKKKNLFSLVALATLTLGSCTNDEVVNDYSQDNAIQFGTYMGRDAESRDAVAVTDLSKVKEDGFGVFAVYNQDGSNAVAPNFMNNQEVTWDGVGTTDEGETTGTDTWTYAPVKYWPNNVDAEVSFWAYSPYSDDNNEATLPSFKILDGVDYVATECVTSEKQAVDGKVLFTFAHVMSRIGFKVEAIIDELEHAEGDDGEVDETEADDKTSTTTGIAAGTTIVVTEVSLNYDFVGGGTMTWDNGTSAWTLNASTDKASTHVLTETNFAKSESVEYTNVAGAEELKGQKVAIHKEQLNNTSSYFMVVPQTATNMTITVEYSVITEDSKLATGFSRVDNKVTSAPFNFSFERNNSYNFVLHLGMTSVKFDAEVSDQWEEGGDYIVNVPINTETTPANPEEGGQTNTGGVVNP